MTKLFLPKNAFKEKFSQAKASLNSVPAFGLIEVAITLIVFSILAGMAIKGYHLVERSRLKALVAEVESLQYAIYVFQEKYQTLPGDLSDAKERISPDLANGNGNHLMEGGECDHFFSHLIKSGLWTSETAKMGGLWGVSATTEGYWLMLGQKEKPVFTPQDAEEIDHMLDDGKPDTGRVRASGDSCTKGAHYNRGDKSMKCSLSFLI